MGDEATQPPVRSTVLAVLDGSGEWVYVDDRITVVDMPYVRAERDPETIGNYLQIFREYGGMDAYVQELEDLLRHAVARVKGWNERATAALAVWESALGGDSGDAEMEAGVDLAELVREVLDEAAHE